MKHSCLYFISCMFMYVLTINFLWIVRVYCVGHLCFGIPNLDHWFVLDFSKVDDERHGFLINIERLVSSLKDVVIAHDLLNMFLFDSLLISFELNNDGAIQEEVNDAT